MKKIQCEICMQYKFPFEFSPMYHICKSCLEQICPMSKQTRVYIDQDRRV